MSASRSASATFSRPQARLVPTSLSSRCRFTSQPSRGVDDTKARKPRTVPCTAKAIRSSERMSRPARRPASPACSARALTVSRISRMRTCSRRERIQGSASSASPFRTSGRHCANGPLAVAMDSMRSPWPSSSARKTASVPVASRRMSRLWRITASALPAVMFWKSTAILVQARSMPSGGRSGRGCHSVEDSTSEAVNSGIDSPGTCGTPMGSPCFRGSVSARRGGGHRNQLTKPAGQSFLDLRRIVSEAFRNAR